MNAEADEALERCLQEGASMSATTKVATAVAAGYLLGRTKKLRLAITVGSMLAGGRLAGDLQPRALLEGLADNPEVKRLGDQLRGQVLRAAKSAAVNVATSRLEALNGSLQNRGSEDEPEGEQGEEAEDEYDDQADEPEDQADEPEDQADDSEDETDESDDRSSDSDRSEPRKTARKPASKTGEAARKAAPSKRTPSKRPASKTAAATSGASKTSASKTSASKTAASGTRAAKKTTGGTGRAAKKSASGATRR